MSRLHPTCTIERLIAAERLVNEALAELSEISTDADYLLEEAVSIIKASMKATAATYGDGHFPPRSAESVLADHNYPPIAPQVTAADVTLGCDAVVTLRDAAERLREAGKAELGKGPRRDLRASVAAE